MPPVVVIANRLPDVDDEDKFRWAGDMRTRGATTFICRPFRTGGRTLDRVIEKLLAGQTNTVRLESVPLVPMKESPVPPGTTNAVPLGPLPPAPSKPASPSKETVRDTRPPSPAPPPEGKWMSVPNDPIELDEFMAKFCEQRSLENRVCRKRALLAAARHKTVTLPPLAAPRKTGQPNKYFTNDLLAAWQGFIDAGVDVPPLLAKCQSRG